MNLYKILRRLNIKIADLYEHVIQHTLTQIYNIVYCIKENIVREKEREGGRVCVIVCVDRESWRVLHTNENSQTPPFTLIRMQLLTRCNPTISNIPGANRLCSRGCG